MRKKNENVALTLEERNIECANEWKTFGTIRNARFISVEELPETKCLHALFQQTPLFLIQFQIIVNRYGFWQKMRNILTFIQKNLQQWI